MKIFPLDSPEGRNVIKSLHTDPPVLLVGSAVSLWKPSDLPTGQSFTSAMYSILFERRFTLEARENRLLRKLFNSIPFEHLLELCPSQEKAIKLINLLYTSTLANPVHHVIAKALRSGKATSVITTNYDCCIDSALTQQPGAPFLKVVTEDEINKALVSSSSCYFKIHGSTEQGLENTPVFTLRHEKLLDKEKRELLTKLLTKRTLLLLGYSGLDFELCPEIARIPDVRIVWNNLTSNFPSSNAKTLLEKTDGCLIHGDMLRLLSELFGPVDAKFGGGGDLPEKVINDIFSVQEIIQWGIEILNSIGTPKFTLKAIEQEKHILPDRFLKWHYARALFHSGRYLTAARVFINTGIKALTKGERVEAANILLDASDAFRSAGALIRAYLLIHCSRFLFRNRTQPKSLLKEALVLENIARLAAKFRLRRFSNIFIRVLRSKLLDCAHQSLSNGNWFDFQQVGLIANRTGISKAELALGEYYPPPDPNDGYTHLGYYIAQVMCFLELCRLELPDKLSGGVPPSMQSEWRKHVRQCCTIGLDSGVWKLLAFRDRFIIRSRRNQEEADEIFQRSFSNCQYRPIMRALQLRRYDSTK